MVDIFAETGDILRTAASKIVMRHYTSLAPQDIAMKAPHEPVTIADNEAEALISSELVRLRPDARVIGEEAAADNPALLQRLAEGVVWVVDPIDGTANYAAGKPPFAMMIALLEKGELVGSWILDPLKDRLAVAQRGAGAWLDGVRLRCDTAMPERDDLTGIVSQAFQPRDKQFIVDRLRRSVATVVPTARCAGHEYPLVATGTRHFALYWRTLIWDHAPGVLLLTEAGGSATYLDRTPYDPCRFETGLLLCHNASIARSLLDLVAMEGPPPIDHDIAGGLVSH
jgi:fructose-1,6-bisphosphatase/inositol monophosphatase family enzyme